MADQDESYNEAVAAHAAALARVARAYEAVPEERRDLLQEIHIALWRSLSGFDGRCSHAQIGPLQLRLGIYLTACVLFCVVLVYLNRLAARRLQAQIDKLDALPKMPRPPDAQKN